MIAVHNLDLMRGRRSVLRDISFTLERGTITGLLGASGTGKTTLMRALLGLQRIAGGTITIDDLPAGDPTLRERIGYVTQGAAIYPDLTVAQNVGYFAALYGAAPDAVATALQTVGLADRGADLAHNLSGGQQNRVSLACALVGSPDVLIMDEPTVGLDPLLIDQLWSAFNALAAKGTTLLVSSHVMDEADRCARVLFLRDGGLIADGSPADLRAASGAADMNSVFVHFAGGPKDQEMSS
ncbi:ABC transporter ATP-binding protein [Cumulibacter soli]|uniref:ABC transporter ATP-binding protein n=1 Tax=Cumulibacter soli TaxID=2546344 RepID=UPI001067BBB8|nr:ABC transporter ATP-binding protein [Cumulibacter soli]